MSIPQSINDLDPGQLRAIDFVCQHYRSMLWLDMSAGKSLIWLTAAAHLLKHRLIRGMLALAPVKVAQATWPEEIEKFPWLRHLRVAHLYGGGRSAEGRVRELLKPADVYLANYEQLPNLAKLLHLHFVSQEKPLPFDFLALDEIVKLKNSRVTQGTKSFHFLRTITPHMTFISGGTGTPASKGLKDLFGQYLVLDEGARLGTSYSAYRDTFFRNRSRDARYDILEPMPGSEASIIDRIKDITFQMTEEERIKLPPYTYHDLWVTLPSKTQGQYDSLEKTLFALLDAGEKVTAPNVLAKRSYLRQLANGAVYTNKETREWSLVHNTKLDMLKGLVAHLQGQPLLLSYMYVHDWQRIQQAFGTRCVRIDGALSSRRLKEINEAWNRGEIEILAGHHASIGHGLNIQGGGSNVCWFGTDEHSGDFLQFNARLRRRNQKADKVTVYRILARETIDEAIVDTIHRDLVGQHKLRNNLLESLKSYRKRKETKR